MFTKKNWQIILAYLLVTAVFISAYGRFGDIIVDSFREAYIPQRILNGEIPYKNIFTIYAPFAYLFNTLLFKVFGVSLKVLYGAGLVSTLIIVYLIFKISDFFLDRNETLAIVLFFISASVLSPNVFNMFFPYSYGMLYGLIFILGAIYFGINKKFIPAYFFYSLAICSKYEFVFLLPLLIIYNRPLLDLKPVIALFLPPAINFTPLFCHGMRLIDLSLSAQIVFTMMSTKTLHWFYSVSGLVFRRELLPIYITNFLKVFVPLILFYMLDKKHFFQKKFSFIFYPLLVLYFYFSTTPEIFIYIFPLILVMFLLKFNKTDYKIKFFVLASLLISLKLFSALVLKSYGIYFIPTSLLALYILLPQNFRKSFAVILICASIALGAKNISALYQKNFPVRTEYGVVKTSAYYGSSVDAAVKFVSSITDKNDRVVVYPELLAVNFLTGRKSDSKFYSLIPLYVETFGSENIIHRLEYIKPEYIILSNYDTSNYYYKTFGMDYAEDIMFYITSNYTIQYEIGDNFKLYIYKLNSLPLRPSP